MTALARPPRDDEFELTLLGPGYGESVVLHVGGGAWILVDSCGRAEAPSALEYLRSLALDPSAVVVLVVATHWHDDHIRGMARMVEVCANAAFCCSSVLCQEEFLTSVHALERRHVAPFASGLREIYRTLSRLRAVGTHPLWALANRPILVEDRCQVWSLAPADEAFSSFLRTLGRLLPRAGESETRVQSLSPNDAAVVLWVTVGDIAVLLGSDLERGGWSTIVQDTARPLGKGVGIQGSAPWIRERPRAARVGDHAGAGTSRRHHPVEARWTRGAESPGQAQNPGDDRKRIRECNRRLDHSCTAAGWHG